MGTRRPPRLAPAESAQPRALSIAEREHVLGVLNCDRFVDMAPAQVYATLLSCVRESLTDHIAGERVDVGVVADPRIRWAQADRGGDLFRQDSLERVSQDPDRR